MAESNLAPIQSAKLSINQAFISGKIVNKRKLTTQAGALYLTLLRLAAVDVYSHPGTIELRSHDSLGEIDETITVKVQLGGMPNNFQVKSVDKQTGDEKLTPVKSARNEFTVISAS